MLDSFLLTPLIPELVYEDFAIVTASAQLLQGLFGNTWPDDLTLEKNLVDLTRHDREFKERHAFSWVIRAKSGAYLGCAYVNPRPDMRGKAKVFTWIADRPDRLTLLSSFNEQFRAWITPQLPNGYETEWASNDF
ncbi:MAG: hypothetical protein GKR98_17660 [Boseongicola sp.]|nr:MAG: hypothetical protein GKR98_17660 [Boseongicola sp.]